MKNNPLKFVDPTGRKERPPTPDQSEAIAVPNTKTLIDYDNPSSDSNCRAFNCHSLTWHAGEGDPTDDMNNPVLPRWDNDPVDDAREQGFEIIDANEPNQPGDRVLYLKPGVDASTVEDLPRGGVLHSAEVVAVDSEGNTTSTMSKWGQGSVMFHHPAVVPSSYGDNRVYLRESSREDK